MHTIKPLQLSILHKTFVWDDRPRFAVGILLGFPLDGGEPILEQDLWRMLADELGGDGILDMGMPKPRGEVLAFGSFHAAEGQAVTAGRVALRVGPINKELAVVGDRYWRTLIGPTEPQPFREMPITYDRAFGGKNFAPNPTGKGLDEVDVFGEMRLPMPNIEDPRHLITSTSHRPDPAGFGPLDIMWEYRAKKVGTYDDKWLKERAPGYAEDLDWTHFNAAPPDQWLPAFFEGNEAFSVEFMHPQRSLIQGRLPDLRARCFVNRRTDGETRFEEIETHPETLYLFPRAEVGVLLYRGTLNINEDDASDISHLLLAYENRGDAPRPQTHYRAAMDGRIDPDTRLRFMLSTRDLIAQGHTCGFARMAAAAPAPAGALMENLQTKGESIKEEALQKLEEQKQQLAEQLKAAGVDPAPYLEKMKYDPEAAMQDPYVVELMRLMEEMAPGITTDPKNLDLSRLDLGKMDDIRKTIDEMAAAKKAEVREQLEAQVKQLEANPDAGPAAEKLRDTLRSFDEPPKLPRTPGPEMLESLRKQVEDTNQLIEQMRAQGVPEDQLPKLDIDLDQVEKQLLEGGARLRDAYRMGAHMMDKGTPPHEEPTDIVAYRLMKAIGKGESPAGGDYAGIDLSGRDLRALDFSNCYLEDVDFSGADLSGANLTGAIAPRCNFSGAKLAGANLARANVGACNFTGADLSDVSFEAAVIGRARFARARMQRVRLTGILDMLGAEFAGADLSDAVIQGAVMLELDLSGARFNGAEMLSANLVKCHLEQAEFNSAILDGSNFVECQLPRARFEQARMTNVRFLAGCNLAQAHFDGALLDKSNFRNAEMTGASLRGTSINMADFGEVNLQDASFAGAVGIRSQFIKTDLAKADIASANLMEANLMKARLTSARLDSANLYSAEFMGAIVGGTSFVAANLDLTKIEHWRPS